MSFWMPSRSVSAASPEGSTARRAAIHSCRSIRACVSNRKPSVVRSVPARDRVNSRAPKAASSAAMRPEIVDCVTVTGESDYVLRIVTRDMHAYDEFLREKVLALGLVSDVQSQIVMRVSKRTTATPLDLAPAA